MLLAQRLCLLYQEFHVSGGDFPWLQVAAVCLISPYVVGPALDILQPI